MMLRTIMHHLLLFLFMKVIKILAFHCSSDTTTNEIINEFHMEKNSMATKFRSIDSLFIFDRPCHCEYDWKGAFCARLNAYRRMSSSESPSFCICRQFEGLKHGCLQFTTRCFPSIDSNSVRQLSSEESPKCRCCFNQPDDYCNQLDCNEMKPTFGPSTNTSCFCYTKNNYPNWICNPKKNKSGVGFGKAQLYNSLSNDQINELKVKKPWPYAENIAFVEDINLKRRIQDSHEAHTSGPEKQLQKSPKPDVSGVWIGENVVMLPMLVATCVVLLGITGFGCFLLIVTKMHSKSRNAENGVIVLNNPQLPSPKQPIIKRHYEKNNSGSPKTSTRILQNKLDHNAIRLTHSTNSTKMQLLKPSSVKFASMPRNTEICELVYNNPCTCKKPSVTLTV